MSKRRAKRTASPRDPASTPAPAPRDLNPTSRSLRVVVLLAGLILPQCLLYGPSLIGLRILLPLDILAQDNRYLPGTPDRQDYLPVHNRRLSDQILSLAPSREFSTREIRAGRLPLWCPNYFLGAPFTKWPKYSPYNALYYLFPYATTLAWMHLAKTLVAGVGAYLFFRRALDVHFVPAVVGAWCYPLSGFFMLWQGYTMAQTISWFPWLLLATDSTVLQPRRFAPLGLAAVTALIIYTGQIDVAALALVAAGLYALYHLGLAYFRDRDPRQLTRTLVTLAAAWALGLLLSTPYLLPQIDYARTGYRFASRTAGAEERPPIGFTALAQVVLPEIYGRDESGSFYLAAINRLESAAAGHAGLLAALVLAPLAAFRRQHRARNAFWLLLALLGIAWTIDLYGFVQLARLPGLNQLSYNRFVFATGFAILALAVQGLDVIRQPLTFRLPVLLPILVIALLALESASRTIDPPEPIATELHDVILAGQQNEFVATFDDVRAIQSSYRTQQLAATIICLAAIAAWFIALAIDLPPRRLATVLAILMLGELLWYARATNPQTDPQLDFPPVPALAELAERPPGRVLGFGCLPARLAETAHLRDIRGYDGVDPSRLMDLMLEVPLDPAMPYLPYALTQWYLPRMQFDDETGEPLLHPVLDMLNLRYVIFRGPVPSVVTPQVARDDYWIVENPEVLPRLFVPRRVESVPDASARIARLADESFDPRQLALVETPLDLPERAAGSAVIESEQPTKIVVRADMRTAGLLVLADLYDDDWRADRNGQSIPIHPTNHALRGIELPAGESVITFRYEPSAFRAGLYLALAALIALALWAIVITRTIRAPSNAPAET